MEKKNFRVTVYCTVYNHEKYIGQTLQGFVEQKVNFPFRVIVHDDASTDNSRAIIEKYAAQYPEIIYPIYQTENKYSHGGRIYYRFIQDLVDSEYVACCEGDDFWCDEQKLQLQYDYMESHPECTMCVHNSNRISAEDDRFIKKVNSRTGDCDYHAPEIIVAPSGSLFQTSSFFYRKKDRAEMPLSLQPEDVGDYPLAIYLAHKGYIHYIDRVMSSYRVSVPGSWTMRVGRNPEKMVLSAKSMISCLESYNKLTHGKYDTEVKTVLARQEYTILRLQGRYRELLTNPDMRKVYLKTRFREKVAVVVLMLFPWLKKLKKAIMG